MSCPGIHCPNCSPAQSAGIFGGVVACVAFAAAMNPWVAEHLAEIAVLVVVCFALSFVIAMRIERRSDARCVAYGIAHGIASAADRDALTPAYAAYLDRHPARKAIAPLPPLPPQVVNNYYIVTEPAQARAVAALAGAQPQHRVLQGTAEEIRRG